MSNTFFSSADPVDSVAKSADGADHGPHRLANHSIEGFSADASKLFQRGNVAMHKGGAQMRDTAEHARDATRGYIYNAPLQSVLMAAAAGAALMWLGSLLGRHGPR